MSARCVTTAHAAPTPSALARLSALFQPRSAWVPRLAEATLALERGTQPQRIAMVGASAPTHALLHAVLSEPLEPEVMSRLAALPALARFWVRGGREAPAADAVSLPLAWLEGRELLALTDLQDLSAACTELFACDAVYLVLDVGALERQEPSALRVLQLAERLADKPSTMLVVNTDVRQAYGPAAAAAWDLAAQAVHQHVAPTLLQRLRAANQDVDVDAALSLPGVRFVSTPLAEYARSILPSEGFPEFTRQFHASRFSALHLSLTQHRAPERRVQHTARAALEALTDAEQAELERLEFGDGLASVLDARTRRAEDDALQCIVPQAPLADAPTRPAWQRRGDQSTTLAGQLADARAVVASTLAYQFPWWRLLWRADEVRLAVSYAAGAAFAGNEETRLAYEAGRLRDVARRQWDAATAVLRDIAQHDPRGADRDAVADRPLLPLATLRNALATYDDRQMSALLHPYCLSEPLRRRREQLQAPGGPIDRLATNARRAVLQTYAGLATGYSASALGAAAHASPVVAAAPTTTLGAAWWNASWVPAWEAPAWLAWLDMAPSTAAGTALLTTAAAAWYLQGRWSRLKRAFWRDWDRTAAAAERDQRESAEAVLRTMVFGAPWQVADALSTEVAARRTQQTARLAELRQARAVLQPSS